MAQIDPFCQGFESGPDTARDALSAICAHLGPLQMSSDVMGTIELVLAEALNNIVEHAYPEPDPAGPITVRFCQAGAGLDFEITDQGRMMPGGELPAGQPADVTVDFLDLPEGGFGWSLIRELTQELSYKREGQQNHLSLRLGI